MRGICISRMRQLPVSMPIQADIYFWLEPIPTASEILEMSPGLWCTAARLRCEISMVCGPSSFYGSYYLQHLFLIRLHTPGAVSEEILAVENDILLPVLQVYQHIIQNILQRTVPHGAHGRRAKCASSPTASADLYNATNCCPAIYGNLIAWNSCPPDHEGKIISSYDLAAYIGEIILAFTNVDMVNAYIFAHQFPCPVSSYHDFRFVFLDEGMAKQCDKLGAIMGQGL